MLLADHKLKSYYLNCYSSANICPITLKIYGRLPLMLLYNFAHCIEGSKNALKQVVKFFSPLMLLNFYSYDATSVSCNHNSES
jgi:hypothetical protein